MSRNFWTAKHRAMGFVVQIPRLHAGKKLAVKTCGCSASFRSQVFRWRLHARKMRSSLCGSGLRMGNLAVKSTDYPTRVPVHDVDLGADGPAAMARVSRETPIAEPGASSAKSHTVYVRRIRDESQLDAENSRLVNALTDRQWRAGCIFRGAWHAMRGAPRVVSQYNNLPRGGAGADMQVGRSDARALIDAALEQLKPAERLAVIGVAGLDEYAWGRRRALGRGLDALADWWDIPSDFRRWRA